MNYILRSILHDHISFNRHFQKMNVIYISKCVCNVIIEIEILNRNKKLKIIEIIRNNRKLIEVFNLTDNRRGVFRSH